MRLTRCPACRVLICDDLAVCRCGLDLAAIRAEFDRLTSPAAGAVVVPIGVVRKLTRASRRAIARALDRAKQAH